MSEKTEHSHGPLEDRISEETREHFRNAREEFHKSIKGMLPPEFAEHRQKARKEMLLAFRSMIDASLNRMEESQK
jgi:ribosomal protein L13